MKLKISLFFINLFFSIFLLAQSEIPKGWHLLDAEKDGFYGISLNKAYDFLKDKKIKSKTVIVAVLDCGADTLQEDLKEVLWHNEKEIPNNGIDDDKNGYVDDYFGWNFLGNKNGENVVSTGKESSRFYHLYKSKFLNDNLDTTKFSNEEKKQFLLWKKCSQDLSVSPDKEIELIALKMAFNSLKTNATILKKELNLEDFTGAVLEKLETNSPSTKKSKHSYLNTISILQIDMDEKNSTLLQQFEEQIDKQTKEMDALDAAPVNEHESIIKDTYKNFNDKFYGNKNIMAKDPTHGTHVSGIIGAKRNNNLGMDGVADNVKIMELRVVPDGDEFDKDVALGIFYAVNNGAKVINMSFGKSFSPEKFWVDSAIKYAASKDVLIVHAAGNDSKNVDSVDNFPSPVFEDNNMIARNFITVGASTDPKISGNSFVADFSNYGKQMVDVFAPGVKIYSTMPGVNNYANQKGTSMAAPVVSGVAALLRSYFPNLTAIQTKQIIEKSVLKVKEEEELNISIMGINIPQKKIKNSCKSLGIVNAENAVKLAYEKYFLIK